MSFEYIQHTLGPDFSSFSDASGELPMHEQQRGLGATDARSAMYAEAMQTLAQVREAMPYDDEDAVAAAFVERARPLLRRVTMLNNVEAYQRAYENGDAGNDLLPHQHEPFRKMLGFLCNEAFHEPGHISIPTAFGKSFLSIKMLEALGVGTPVGNDPQPLRALYLVPRELLLHQIIGADYKRGFGRFAPDLTVTPYYGKEKDLSGDVVAMIYHSYIKATREGVLDDQHFDIKVYDEGHHTLGEHISKTIALHRQKPAKSVEFAVTASKEYDEHRAVSKLFPHEIAKVELRDAIQEGSLASVQCWMYETDSVLHITSDKRSKDFTEQDLAPLRFDQKRNERGVDFIAKFAESGRKGIVRCVAGDGCAHAKEIARLADMRIITDPVTGEKRRLRVAATGDFQTDEEQQEVQARYEDGLLDAIAYVSILDEGWDTPQTKFLIRLAPTRSKVVAIQSLGRILRPYKPKPLAQVVEFLDTLDGPNPPITFIDTLNIDLEAIEDSQGVVVGPNKSPNPDDPSQALDTKDFSEPLVGGLQRHGYKLLYKARLEAKPVPEGWLPTSTLMAYGGLKSYIGLYQFLTRHEMPPVIAKNGQHYYPPEARQLIDEHILDKIAPPDYEPLPSLRDEFAITRERLRAVLGDLSIKAVMFKNATSLADQQHVPAEDAQRLRDYFASRAEKEAHRVSLENLAAQLNTTATTLAKRLPEDITPTWERSMVTHVKQRYVTAREAERVRNTLLPPPGSKTIGDLSKEWDVGLSSLREAITEEDTAEGFTGMHAESKRMLLHYPAEVVERIRARCVAPMHKLNAAMIIDLLGLTHTPDQFINRLPRRLVRCGELWRVRRSAEDSATFFDADLLPAMAKVFNIEYDDIFDRCLDIETFAAQLNTTPELITNYYPGKLHVRSLPHKNARSLYVLPGPMREIKKAPPAREGWLTRTEIIKQLNISKDDRRALVMIDNYLEGRSGPECVIMKPHERRTTPQRHYAPGVTVTAARLLKRKTT